jgi:lysozyme
MRRALLLGAGAGLIGLGVVLFARRGEAAALDSYAPPAQLPAAWSGDSALADAVSSVTEDTPQFFQEWQPMMNPDANVAAFLAMIRQAETGTTGERAYRTVYGGGTFDSFADHPRRRVTAGGLTSTAAGAYQFLESTWDDLRRRFGLAAFPDFTPPMQDKAAIQRIKDRGGLAAVREGRFDEAVARVRREWASLPGAGYGQPERRLADLRGVYESNGGAYA